MPRLTLTLDSDGLVLGQFEIQDFKTLAAIPEEEWGAYEENEDGQPIIFVDLDLEVEHNSTLADVENDIRLVLEQKGNSK